MRSATWPDLTSIEPQFNLDASTGQGLWKAKNPWTRVRSSRATVCGESATVTNKQRCRCVGWSLSCCVLGAGTLLVDVCRCDVPGTHRLTSPGKRAAVSPYSALKQTGWSTIRAPCGKRRPCAADDMAGQTRATTTTPKQVFQHGKRKSKSVSECQGAPANDGRTSPGLLATFRYASNVFRLYTSARLSLLALSMPSVMHLYSAAASRALAGESGSLSSILATLAVAIRTASRLSPRLIASSIDLARSSILAFLSCGSGGGTLLPIMKSGRFLRPPLGGRKALGRGGGPRVPAKDPPPLEQLSV